MTVPKPVRCAIYTRKSSEEGLEQGFNSLDAQYEANAAYVLSQASEGWTTLPERYDDGGVSGGTLERPVLQRLRQTSIPRSNSKFSTFCELSGGARRSASPAGSRPATS